MILSIQQPPYFPWIGYFDKMAKCDGFVLMDEVQMEKRSQMLRNRVLAPNGETKFITIMSIQKGCYQNTYKDVQTTQNEVWKDQNFRVLKEYYRKAPFYKEILEILQPFYEQDYSTVCEWTISSIALINDLLQIKTPLILQSAVGCDRDSKRSDLIMSICTTMNADTYICGRGVSADYLNQERFAENGVSIVFQDFSHPVYLQCNSLQFVPGISILDMLFNCGIEESRRILGENVHSSHEFDTI